MFIPFVPLKVTKIYLLKPGHLTLRESNLLYKNAKRIRKGGIIVEIGSYLGKSTCVISEGIKGKNIKFYAIDTFENHAMSEGKRNTLKDFLKYTKEYRSLITVKKGFSYNVVKKIKDIKIDLLWIDGDHTYHGVKTDIEDWTPLVRQGGIICFHDYRNVDNEKITTRKEIKEVKRAVDEKIKEGLFRKVKKADSIFMAQKI